MTRKITLQMYNDPGHGWLRVPHNLITEVGIADKISACSYMTHNFCYLEEDCDAPLFVEAAEKVGIAVTINDHYSNGTSQIRTFGAYNTEFLSGVKIGDILVEKYYTTKPEQNRYEVIGENRTRFIVRHLPSDMVYGVVKTTVTNFSRG